MVTLPKPDFLRKSATCCACAWVGAYSALNCADARLGWCGLAINASRCALLRRFSDTATCIDCATSSAPTTRAPVCNLVACRTGANFAVQVVWGVQAHTEEGAAIAMA